MSIDLVADLRDLRGRFAGALLAPGDPGWDDARRPWHLDVDQHPAAVAFPESEDDVIAVVLAASELGLRVAPQATGHNAAPLGRLDDTILLRTGAMRGVRVDPRRRFARVRAGALWQDVTPRAAEHGLVGLAGSSPNVGVVGYSLGGGLSWLARRYGLQANHVTAVELVTAGGEHVRTDHQHDPDLFWALRGGGGSFGIVTALEFELVALREVYAGALVWDWRDAGPVLLRYSEWAHHAPDLVTTSARILQLPALPEVPEPLRDRQVVMIDGAYLGDPEDGDTALEPLRALRPEIDTFATMPAGGCSGCTVTRRRRRRSSASTGCSPRTPRRRRGVRGDGRPGVGLGPAGGRATPARRRAEPAPGAPRHAAAPGRRFRDVRRRPRAPRRDGADEPRARAAARDGHGAVGPRPAPPQLRGAPGDASAFYDDDTHARLREVKAQMDPRSLIHANHSIEA
jgi:FAD binding domain-containing protein